MARKSKAQTPPREFQQGWLSQLDNRTALAQTMQDRYRALTNDLGGADRLSYGQRSLCERCLWLEYWLAQQEQRLATDQDFDIGKWTQATNSLQGILAKLGLERKAKDLPDLQAYLRQKAAS